MKRILIVYPSMSIGGSTTSLIGLLNSLDKKKYSIDLQLYKNSGEYIDLIPDNINILPEACPFKNRIQSVLIRAFSYSYWKAFFRSLKIKKEYPNSLGVSQETAYARANISKKSNKEYDVAIGFLEMWPNSYVLQRVKATKKIAWIHVDYKQSGMIAEIDRDRFKGFSNFVLVSKEAEKSFKQIFPEYQDKSLFIENILYPETVIKKSLESNTQKYYRKNEGINFGTVCRIEFRHKGLDRALLTFKKMKDLGYNFCWHIIGNGSDYDKLNQLIDENGLNDNVFLYGEMNNPLPLVKQFEIFLLPSYYEGKPMVITESQMLNVPSLVTNYSSAEEQILNMENGMIVDNSQDGIDYGIKYVLDNTYLLSFWKENLYKKKWSYDDTINKINKLLGVDACDY